MHAAADTSFFARAKLRMEWLQDRQNVLAENIANVDTPKYIPREITPFAQVLSDYYPFTMKTDNPRDIVPADLLSPFGVKKVTLTGGKSIDGNQVNLAHQMALEAQTENAQQLVTELYQAYQRMFATGIGQP